MRLATRHLRQLSTSTPGSAVFCSSSSSSSSSAVLAQLSGGARGLRTSAGQLAPRSYATQADIPRAAPLEGIPFSAPSMSDDTRGNLAQVALPDLVETTVFYTPIPLVPDNDKPSSAKPPKGEAWLDDESGAVFPRMQPPRAMLVSPATAQDAVGAHKQDLSQGSGADDVVTLDKSDSEVKIERGKDVSSSSRAGGGADGLLEELTRLRDTFKADEARMIEALKQAGAVAPARLGSWLHVEGATPEPFEFKERPLTQSERQGLYALAGIVVGGWLLSGLAA